MRFNGWFIAGFAALAVARHPAIIPRSDAADRAILNLPGIKTSLGTLKTDLQQLDRLFNGITTSNVESQLNAINKHLKKMNNDAGTATRKLTSTGEIKLNELLSFLNSKTQNEWMTVIVDLLNVANSTITDVMKKRDIIKASGKADIIAEGLKLQKNSVLTIWDAALKQFPSIAKGMFGLSGGSGKGKGKTGKSSKSSKSGKSGKSSGPIINLGDPALREKIGSSVGDLFDQTIEYLKGTKDSISLPIPSGLGKGKGTGAPKAAGPPKGKSKTAAKAKSKSPSE